VIRYDGQVSVDPSLPDLARAIGVNVDNDLDSSDVAIVGAGPAGLGLASVPNEQSPRLESG